MKINFPVLSIFGFVFGIIVALLLLNSCVTETVVKERVRFVDIETYRDWGTTKLVPIHRRPLPTEDQICNNPMWSDSIKCPNKKSYQRK